MECKKILQILNEDFPTSKAYSWDNVGLLLGREEKNIRKILIALDVTDEVIEEAKVLQVDMLITHHPLLFSPVKTITNNHFIGKRIIELIQSDIAYVAMHTNYDIMRMADLASERLALEDTVPLQPCQDVEVIGLGKFGNLAEACSLKECAELTKKAFDLGSVRVFPSYHHLVSKVAILPGSGKCAIQDAIELGADVLITGDIGHHEGIDAASQGLAIIDAGHYGVEHIFIEDMKTYLEHQLAAENVEIQTYRIEHPFFTV